MLRSMPVLVHEAQQVPVRRIGDAAAVEPVQGGAIRPGRRGNHGRTRAVAEQAGADQHAGIVVEIERGRADLDADRQRVPCLARRQNRFRRAQVGDGRAAALADQVERKRVRPETEAFDHVTGEAGAKIAGAGADDDGVDGVLVEAGLLQRALRRLCGQRRGVLGETVVQRVGNEFEGEAEVGQREIARADAVRALQDAGDELARHRLEFAVLAAALERVQAIDLRVAIRRVGGAQSDDMHPLVLAVVP
jgi:hypothetical protein